MRIDAHPRTFLRPGRRGDGGLLYGFSRRQTRLRRERERAVETLRLRSARLDRNDRAANGRCLRAGRTGFALLSRREFFTDPARTGLRAPGTGQCAYAC